MKLNKYIATIAIAAFSVMFTSCNDFLDKDPENSVPETDVDFSNTGNMYQPVSGVYAKVRTGGMHWIIWPLSVVRDDDVWSGRVDDQQLLVDFGNYKYDNSFWGLNETNTMVSSRWPTPRLNRSTAMPRMSLLRQISAKRMHTPAR